jgi:ABC-type transporter Mla subunit MlaD
MSKLKDIQSKVETSIEQGINKVEEYYSSVSGKTFDYVESIEEKAKTLTTDDVRVKHNEKVASAFDNVRELNKSASQFIDKLLSKLQKDVEEVVEDVKEAVEEAAEDTKEAVAEIVGEEKEAVAEEAPAEAEAEKPAAKKTTRRTRKKAEA